jgi:hypothetical protein
MRVVNGLDDIDRHPIDLLRQHLGRFQHRLRQLLLQMHPDGESIGAPAVLVTVTDVHAGNVFAVPVSGEGLAVSVLELLLCGLFGFWHFSRPCYNFFRLSNSISTYSPRPSATRQ